MTTELAVFDDSSAAVALTNVDPLDNLMRYAEVLDVSYKFAERVCRTTIVPKIYQGKPHDAAVAMMHGAELGLNPLQALQNVFPVHGMPAIYAKTMVALLRQKGYRFKTHETGPERVVFQGWAPDGDDEISEWTIDRAIKAGFVPTIDPETGKFKTKKFDGPTGKYEKLIGNEKYLTQPEEMLWAKAATTVCKRLAPHILLGLAVAEDQEDRVDDEAAPVRVTSERVSPVAVVAGESVAPKVQQWQAPEPPSDPSEKPDNTQVENSADTVAERAAELATPSEQRTLAAELERHGHKTAAAKRKWLSSDTGREITSAKELTGEEAVSIIDRLCRREAGDMPILQSQWTTAEQLLTQLGALDAEKKMMFLRGFLPGREHLADPLDLNEREGAELLAELTQLISDEAPASEQLPIDGAEGGE